MSNSARKSRFCYKYEDDVMLLTEVLGENGLFARGESAETWAELHERLKAKGFNVTILSLKNRLRVLMNNHSIPSENSKNGNNDDRLLLVKEYIRMLKGAGTVTKKKRKKRGSDKLDRNGSIETAPSCTGPLTGHGSEESGMTELSRSLNKASGVVENSSTKKTSAKKAKLNADLVPTGTLSQQEMKLKFEEMELRKEELEFRKVLQEQQHEMNRTLMKFMESIMEFKFEDLNLRKEEIESRRILQDQLHEMNKNLIKLMEGVMGAGSSTGNTAGAAAGSAVVARQSNMR